MPTSASRNQSPRYRAGRDLQNWAASTFFEISTSLKRQKKGLVHTQLLGNQRFAGQKTRDATARQSRFLYKRMFNWSGAPGSNRHPYTCEGSLRRSSSARAGGGLGVPSGPRPSRFGLVPVHLAKAIEWLPGRDAPGCPVSSPW